MTNDRDHQRSKVYAWEEHFVAPRDPSSIVFAQAQGVVDAIWAEMGLRFPPKVERLPRQARSTLADATRLSIRLNESNPSWYLLHELAHAMTSTHDGRSDGHGPVFMGLYAQLLIRYLRVPTDALLKSIRLAVSRPRWKPSPHSWINPIFNSFPDLCHLGGAKNAFFDGYAALREHRTLKSLSKPSISPRRSTGLVAYPACSYRIPQISPSSHPASARRLARNHSSGTSRTLDAPVLPPILNGELYPAISMLGRVGGASRRWDFFRISSYDRVDDHSWALPDPFPGIDCRSAFVIVAEEATWAGAWPKE